jgi:hypothetical protein
MNREERKTMKKVMMIALVFLMVGLLVQASSCKKKMAPVEVNVIGGNTQDKVVQQTEIDQRNEYYSSVMTQKQILSDAFFALDVLIKDPKPAEETWNFQVDALLVKIQKVIENKYGKTCPAIYNDANIEYSKALDAFQYFVKNYPDAIKNLNDDLLRTCSEKLKEGYDTIEFVGKTLEAKKE